MPDTAAERTYINAPRLSWDAGAAAGPGGPDRDSRRGAGREYRAEGAGFSREGGRRLSARFCGDVDLFGNSVALEVISSLYLVACEYIVHLVVYDYLIRILRSLSLGMKRYILFLILFCTFS